MNDHISGKQKYRTAGNSYNLRWKVEVPVEIQLINDNVFLNEFVSQPEPGQSGSKSRSYTDSETSIDYDIGTLLTKESENSIEESPVICQKKKFKRSDTPYCLKNSKPRDDITGRLQSDQIGSD